MEHFRQSSLPLMSFTFLIILTISTANASYSRTPTSSPIHPYDPPMSQHPPSIPTSSLAYEFLAPHNAIRASRGLHPLTWDSKLANYAQWWANQRRHDCSLQHSDSPYGENIFWGSGTNWSPLQAVNDWIIEDQWYDYSTNSCVDGHECGHYTQIVWRDSRRLGCAKVVCYNGAGVFITCNYDPPGNYIGQKPY